MSKRLAFVLLAALFIAVPSRADFDSLVQAVGTIRGLHRVWMPGFGLVRFAVWMVHPEGVHDLQLATFEGKGGDLDPRVFESLLREHADAGYRPLVQAHSRRTGEVTLIWARPQRGDLIELLLLTHEPGDDTVVLRTVVNVETVARQIGDPHHATRIAHR